MKYTVDMEINRPREVVVELFDNTDNLKKWQPDLLSFELQNGEPGRAGATSKLVYRMGNRKIEMIETITSNELPDECSGTYESDGVWNRVENRFSDAGPDKTQWHLESEFRCSGFFKVVAFILPGMFKKQSIKYMKQFKDFVESA